MTFESLSGGSAAFSQGRATAMAEVGTRAALAWHAGPLAENGVGHAERLLGHLSPDMLVLADRDCRGFPLWSRATATGADLHWRVNRITTFPVVEALDDGSWRSVFPGRGRNRGERAVWIVAYQIEGSETTILATTLLDHRIAPAAGLAVLYHEWWEIGTAHDEVRTHMLGPGAVSSRGPAGCSCRCPGSRPGAAVRSGPRAPEHHPGRLGRRGHPRHLRVQGGGEVAGGVLERHRDRRHPAAETEQKILQIGIQVLVCASAPPPRHHRFRARLDPQNVGNLVHGVGDTASARAWIRR